MPHLSLFELNNLIKEKLEKNLETSYWVVAEIGELRVHSKGHCYLELIEKQDRFITAKIKATIWSYQYKNLSKWFENITHTPLQVGLRILVNASVQFHEVYGQSLNIKDIDPNFTLGERARRKQEVIQQLRDEGIFDRNKAIPLPRVPQRIAIISSETAAGYGDFIDQLTQNKRNFRFIAQLFPALMQGDKAVASIIEALQEAASHQDAFDALVIIRGGGAQTDLDCFDQYELATHIARFPLPVIVGIGHERDETIVDLVANTSLKTPTAVAEFLINGMEHFDDLLQEQAYRIERELTKIVRDENHALVQHMNELKFQAHHTLTQKEKQLLHASQAFKHLATNHLKTADQALQSISETFAHFSVRYFRDSRQSLDNLWKYLKLTDPKETLSRGYTISRINGRLLQDVKPQKGDLLTTETSKGEIISAITDKND